MGGSRVAFLSYATNLVDGEVDENDAPDIFVHDLATGDTVNLSLTLGLGYSYAPSLSTDGSTVALTLNEDSNGATDILIYDAAAGGRPVQVTEGGLGSSRFPAIRQMA